MKSKLIAGVLIGSLCSQFAMAQLKDLHGIGNVLGNNDILVQNSLSEVEAAHQQTRILFQTATTNDQKERLRYVNDRLDRAESLLRQALSQPSHPQPPPYNPGGQVEMYRSDSCSSDLVGVVNPGTNCSSYNGASDVWSIKVNGQCTNTLDMSAVQACETFKNANNQQTLRIFRSDSCSSDLSAVVTAYTDCETLSSSNNAWGVVINGQCRNLSDTSPKMACRSLRGAVSTNNVEIYRSDSCSSDLVAIVDRNTYCQSLQGMADAWGIKVNGQCTNIADTNIVQACERFKP